jgi:hypothetical protein
MRSDLERAELQNLARKLSVFRRLVLDDHQGAVAAVFDLDHPGGTSRGLTCSCEPGVEPGVVLAQGVEDRIVRVEVVRPQRSHRRRWHARARHESAEERNCLDDRQDSLADPGSDTTTPQLVVLGDEEVDRSHPDGCEHLKIDVVVVVTARRRGIFFEDRKQVCRRRDRFEVLVLARQQVVRAAAFGSCVTVDVVTGSGREVEPVAAELCEVHQLGCIWQVALERR